MKILFIIPPYILNKTKYAQRSFLTMPYGPLSLVSYTKDICASRIFDCNLYDNHKEMLVKTLKEFYPDVSGISLMFDQSYSPSKDIIKIIKKTIPSSKILKRRL